MRGWMVYLILGVPLDVVGLVLFLTNLGRTPGVVGMMIGLVGVVLTRSGVVLMRRERAARTGST